MMSSIFRAARALTFQIRKRHIDINQLTPEVAPDAATGEIPNKSPLRRLSPQTINPDLVPRCPATVSDPVLSK